MQTHTIALTIAHTATALSAKISGAFQRMLSELGLGEWCQKHDWDDAEHAFGVWLTEKSLKSSILEVYDRATDRLVARFDVPIEYTAAQGAPVFRHDIATTALAAKKVAAGGLKGDLRFRVLADNHDWRTPVPGWGPAILRDSGHLNRRAMGELASGPGIRCSLEYLVK